MTALGISLPPCRGGPKLRTLPTTFFGDIHWANTGRNSKMLLDSITTPRLILRQWRGGDRAPFAAMNADPRVMEFFPRTLTAGESDQMADRIMGHFAAKGFGLWAVEIPDVAEFAGYIGLSVPTFTAPFTPCVEIGWRLAHKVWGHGFATEGARAVLQEAFTSLGLPEIVSFTSPLNVRSIRVMEKIGMVRNPAEDFDHPRVPRGHPLCRHVLYRASRRPA
jgi:ribosomal-protein-alanine N-acetyltransferase